MSKRKRGARDPFTNIEDLDFSEFLTPYEDFTREYRYTLSEFKKGKSLGKRRRLDDINKSRAYTVTYTDDPTLLFVTFCENRYRAKGNATMYFRDNLHPDFEGRKWAKKFTKSRARLHHDFDKYIKLGKVPAYEILKLGARFPCAVCGKHEFTYEDYENKKCFYVEGEGDTNQFTYGIIVCKECIEGREQGRT